MPYLTLWDRIWPIWKAIPLKFKPQNLRTILQQISWRNKHKSHTVVVFTSFLHEKMTLDNSGGAPKVMFKKISQKFVKSPLKCCLISQVQVHSLWHVCLFAFIVERMFLGLISLSIKICHDLSLTFSSWIGVNMSSVFSTGTFLWRLQRNQVSSLKRKEKQRQQQQVQWKKKQVMWT